MPNGLMCRGLALHRRCSQTGHEGRSIAGDRRVRTKDQRQIKRRQDKAARVLKPTREERIRTVEKRVRTIRWRPSSAKKNLRGLIEPAPWDDNERPASGKRQAAKSGKTTRFSSQNKPRGNRNITAKSRCHREKPPLTFSRCRESEHLMGHHKREKVTEN